MRLLHRWLRVVVRVRRLVAVMAACSAHVRPRIARVMLLLAISARWTTVAWWRLITLIDRVLVR